MVQAHGSRPRSMSENLQCGWRGDLMLGACASEAGGPGFGTQHPHSLTKQNKTGVVMYSEGGGSCVCC